MPGILMILDNFSGEDMLAAKLKKEAMAPYQRSENDTGSSEAQIAMLTARIRELQGHFSTHKKDLHSLRGMMQLVSKRRKLLKYLKKTNVELYRKLLQELKIRH